MVNKNKEHQCVMKDEDTELCCYDFEEDGLTYLAIDDEYGQVAEFEVNYCPMCGLKAKEKKSQSTRH